MLSLCRPCAEKFGQKVGTSVASVWMCVPMDEQRRWISAPLRFTMLWFHALSLKQWKALREKLPAGDQKLRDVQFWPTVHAAVMDLWLATFVRLLFGKASSRMLFVLVFAPFWGSVPLTSSQIQLIRKPFGRTKNMPKVRETPIVPRVPSWVFFHAFSLKKSSQQTSAGWWSRRSKKSKQFC